MQNIDTIVSYDNIRAGWTLLSKFHKMQKVLKILFVLLFMVHASGLSGLVHELSEHCCACDKSAHSSEIALNASSDQSDGHHNRHDHDAASCPVCQAMAISKVYVSVDSSSAICLELLSLDNQEFDCNIILSNELSVHSPRAPPAFLF